MEVHVCQECAKVKTKELKQQLSAPEFLSSLVGDFDSGKERTPSKCPLCCLTLHDLKSKGILGCAQCYTNFRPQLMPLVKKIHGSTHHKGKIPHYVKSSVVLDRRIEVVRNRLNRAIQLEEYEEAARLRDEVRDLENSSNL